MLAHAAFGLVERHLCNFASVDANRWQSSAGSYTSHQPLEERSFICNCTGSDPSRIPYGKRSFEIRFDFIRQQVVLETSEGALKTLPLAPRSVADFYQEFMKMLRSEQIEVKIWRMPVEIPNPIAFDQDRGHASYDPTSSEFGQRLRSIASNSGIPSDVRRSSDISIAKQITP